jgi:hypothetical protein
VKRVGIALRQVVTGLRVPDSDFVLRKPKRHTWLPSERWSGMRGRRIPIAGAVLGVMMVMTAPVDSRALRPFTVADGIGLARLERYLGGSAIVRSPNGRLVAVWAERGILDKNTVQDEVRVYATVVLRRYVLHPQELREPRPLLDLRESTYGEGPIIKDIRWLRSSKGLVFLLRSEHGNFRLALLSFSNGHPRILSRKGQDVTAFGVRDLRRYVYSVFTPGGGLGPLGDNGWVAWDGTGHSLGSALFPTEWLAMATRFGFGIRSTLWAATEGVPHEVISRETDQQTVMYPRTSSLALSPDGHTLAVELPAPTVPRSWLRRFPPPRSKLYGMQTGRQGLDVTLGNFLVGEYFLIDLRSGKSTAVNGAPTGFSNGWWSLAGPRWSDDGKALLLPDVYPQPSNANLSVGSPCAAVYHPATRTMRCLAPLRRRFPIKVLRFAGHESNKVMMQVRFGGGGGTLPLRRTTWFARTASGAWRVVNRGEPSAVLERTIRVSIKQGLNDPPVVVASDPGNKVSRVIWNPNPQLEDIAFGAASVYRWKDATGRMWAGGLYRPPDYVAGRRYPLVIQTHGFSANEFHPSGVFPSPAFAARALAASGIVVLQTPECPIHGSIMEGPCNVAGYEGAVRALSAKGLIDPNRIGIIGFSATVYHVLQALTSSALRFAAASVTDGLDMGYVQYLETVDSDEDLIGHFFDADIGAKPFGAGLGFWLKHSPEFNMQRVHAPLLVVGPRRFGVLSMWEPYAELRYLGKPVDLLMLNTDEHAPLTEPAVRMVSQGSEVDWFRFWLQGYESPHPALPSEYRRWERLCDTQIEENPSSPTFCIPTVRFREKHFKAHAK